MRDINNIDIQLQTQNSKLKAQEGIKAAYSFNHPSMQKKGLQPVDYGKYGDSSSDENQIGKIEAGDGPSELSDI